LAAGTARAACRLDHVVPSFSQPACHIAPSALCRARSFRSAPRRWFRWRTRRRTALPAHHAAHRAARSERHPSQLERDERRPQASANQNEPRLPERQAQPSTASCVSRSRDHHQRCAVVASGRAAGPASSRRRRMSTGVRPAGHTALNRS
jgi:hypothetical protein